MPDEGGWKRGQGKANVRRVSSPRTKDMLHNMLHNSHDAMQRSKNANRSHDGGGRRGGVVKEGGVSEDDAGANGGNFKDSSSSQDLAAAALGNFSREFISGIFEKNAKGLVGALTKGGAVNVQDKGGQWGKVRESASAGVCVLERKREREREIEIESDGKRAIERERERQRRESERGRLRAREKETVHETD